MAMITPSTASLALSVAKGLIQFGNRLDQLRAEKVAVRSGLTLTLRTVRIGPGPNRILPRLQDYLQHSSPAAPGPLTVEQRADVTAKLVPGYVYQPADLPRLQEFYGWVDPEFESETTTIVPDKKYLDYLRQVMPAATNRLPDTDKDLAA